MRSHSKILVKLLRDRHFKMIGNRKESLIDDPFWKCDRQSFYAVFFHSFKKIRTHFLLPFVFRFQGIHQCLYPVLLKHLAQRDPLPGKTVMYKTYS